MMMRPPSFMCFSAACVVASTPRRVMSITRSISSSVVSSNVFGKAVPALLTSTSSRPNVATVFSTALLTASASAASAWIATAFPPSCSIALTTAEAALASFAYVIATFAPSAARRLAMAAPMPREPPVMSAIFPSSFLDIVFLLFFGSRSFPLLLTSTAPLDVGVPRLQHTLLSWDRCFASMGAKIALRHLRCFVAVAEAGGLTGAAQGKLHTSQPSLSRQIRDLEKEVGAQLLTRRARGIELTPAGRTFLDHARLVLSQVDAASEAARRVAHPSKPCFTIGFLTGHELRW